MCVFEFVMVYGLLFCVGCLSSCSRRRLRSCFCLCACTSLCLCRCLSRCFSACRCLCSGFSL